MIDHTLTKSDYRNKGQLREKISLRNKLKIDYAIRTTRKPMDRARLVWSLMHLILTTKEGD